jgi:hypothetical protein
VVDDGECGYSVACYQIPQTSGGLLGVVPRNMAQWNVSRDLLQLATLLPAAPGYPQDQIQFGSAIRRLTHEHNVAAAGRNQTVERRTLLTPDIARARPGWVQHRGAEKSSVRIFDDEEEYANAGCELVDTHAWHQAPIPLLF